MSYKVLVERVQTVIARATRYRLEVLTEDANLENELGIDSFKMIEILVRIREEFGIGEERTIKRDEVKTIGAIARLLETLTVTITSVRTLSKRDVGSHRSTLSIISSSNGS